VSGHNVKKNDKERKERMSYAGAMREEEKIRRLFHHWVQQGTRSFMYDLTQLAGGDYVSVYTEQAWRAFKAGYEAK
jgi:hypothetical protein